jgi:hypothetical protein
VLTAKKEHLLQPETQSLTDLLQKTVPVLTVALHAGSLHVAIPYASGRGSKQGNKYATSDEEVRRCSTVIFQYRNFKYFHFD